jgi:hypothetical protein
MWTYTADVPERETRLSVTLRQILGAAKFKAGPLLAFSIGNLCYRAVPVPLEVVISRFLL